MTGTGKTTMARLLARIYQSLGILSRGQLAPTDRSGMVAGYVGQTALKVREVVGQAIGGVTFIDEAYALGSREGQDFGQEAIDTLTQVDGRQPRRFNRHRRGLHRQDENVLVVQSGPTVESNKYFNFTDYNPEQLVEIFELFCAEAGFGLSSAARDKVSNLFQVFHAQRDDTFGNARLARNIFEQVMQRHANRIVTLADIDEGALSMIEAEDIPSDFDDAI